MPLRARRAHHDFVRLAAREGASAAVVDLLQGGQGVFGIAIGGVWREIEGTLSELPSERTADEEAAPHANDELAARRARKSG